MKLFILIFYVILFFNAASISRAADISVSSPEDVFTRISSTGLNLKECYQRALQRSETIAVQEQVIEEARGRFLQAFSGILPEFSYVVSERYQDGSNQSGFSLSKVPERRFTFSQPLFSGFKEFAAIAAGGAEKRQREHELRRAQEILFVDVADAFYLYLVYQDEIDTLAVIHQALEDRIKELKERQELGRSRASEVASAQARLSRIKADLEQAQGDGEVARQLLEFLTGDEVTSLIDEDLSADLTVEVSEYVSSGEKRADVLAVQEAWQAARKNITVARSGFFPEASVDGNYYQKRVGNSSGVDWDVTLSIDVPLFKGGENVGLLREAKSFAKQEELNYQRAKRQAVLEIQNAYTKFQVSSRREEALLTAYQAAEENYRLQLEDYSKNLVNNLEVLQALEDLQETRRAWMTAKSERKHLYWNLVVASGRLHDTF